MMMSSVHYSPHYNRLDYEISKTRWWCLRKEWSILREHQCALSISWQSAYFDILCVQLMFWPDGGSSHGVIMLQLQLVLRGRVDTMQGIISKPVTVPKVTLAEMELREKYMAI